MLSQQAKIAIIFPCTNYGNYTLKTQRKFNGVQINPFIDKAQTALFKDPVRTAL